MRSHGDEGCSQEGCPHRVFLAQHAGALLEEVQAFSGSPGEEFPIVSTIHGGGDGAPPSGDMGEQYPQGGKHGDSQNDGLEDVCPDDGFQSSDRGINCRGDGDGNQGGNVEQDNLVGVCRDACQELVGNDQQNARE